MVFVPYPLLGSSVVCVILESVGCILGLLTLDPRVDLSAECKINIECRW